MYLAKENHGVDSEQRGRDVPAYTLQKLTQLPPPPPGTPRAGIIPSNSLTPLCRKGVTPEYGVSKARNSISERADYSYRPRLAAFIS